MKYVVKPGEHLSRIGRRFGVLPEEIWKDPGNAELVKKRKTPNILHPGDELEIPEKSPKSVDVGTDQCHVFRTKYKKKKINLVLKDGFGAPLKNLDYRLEADGQEIISGNTGDSGKVTAEVPADTTGAYLFAGGKEFSFLVGDLNPISRISGVQQRLKNLGFDCGPADGVLGPRTRNAILAFQHWADLKPTGRLDDDTRDKIEELHDGTSRKIQAEEEHDSVPGVEVSDEEWVEKDVASMPHDDDWDGLPGEDEFEEED